MSPLWQHPCDRLSCKKYPTLQPAAGLGQDMKPRMRGRSRNLRSPRLARGRHDRMNCASCGKDNVDDARFCVHCGARQSEPTPIAVVAAAAMSRGAAARTQAANAAHAESGATVAGDRRAAAPAARATPAAWSPSEFGESVEGATGGVGPATSSPAHGASPRLGLAAVLIGGFVLAGIVAFAGWHVLHDGAGADIAHDQAAGNTSIMSAFPPENTPHRTASPAAIAPAAPPLPAASAAESAPNPERTAPLGAAPQADAAASPRSGGAAPASGHTPAVEIRALPSRPAHPAASPRAPVEKKKAPPPPPVAVEAAPARAATPPAPVAAPSPPPDRWARMKDDLSRCTREDFIARVVCDQRTRWRYCDGYWGKAVQCPANPTTPERGQ